MKINKKGFTLIEILVVILIIGVLAAIALPQYNMAVMKSRYSTMMNIVNAISDAEERYYLLHDEYSATFDGLDIELSGCPLSNDKQICNYDWGYCSIDISGVNRVQCYNNTTLHNAHVHYLKQG
ncbi:MAG: prepilin-type N-terminal cleavage/methylation domain-containing protein, partial [Elusimicrobiaceae bacterium]|nr:prepilin-type N-terminal cleavage/methylation domain-containing protein [Elusimicrobiaceae bacterium]